MVYKYQESFARELTEQWINGNHEHVRLIIRGLKNKAQAAFIAAQITHELHCLEENALHFVNFIHPNN